eukprot:Gregarina_sp_Poly_1__3620@NODE_2066_length_2743_cov_35_734305_g1334_i0_p1_GENE_NODE_2066_length_2743_cov_35_734305_g1334_i0NODE_2066_length_2743_cov_35_734305_g1334_i0_p1_ORF_typecomplete_len820_score136_22Suf/PF05843_14/8_2e06Suf/PF05843_14/1_1e02Suf/PF05843_14/3_4e05Suf/PF05843_14/3_2e12Suf/PF05843_14/3_9e09TPR_15/PF13429_6/1_2e03TPR_15/PF13429_6/0_18TPR_15/PF13429_6/1_1e02TPR_15/PF13429_6/0_75TPR_15/PF13429_6/3e05TPR_15/PF13429_6/6_6TPR_MalT/PF17874_1/75TPR_MalT/PF17874_1/0_15TPR_MalT/PF17874
MEVLASSEFRLFSTVDAPIDELSERKPRDLKAWLTYLNANRHHDGYTRLLLQCQAVRELPASYKLWESLFAEFDVLLNESTSPDASQTTSVPDSNQLMDAMEICFQKAVAYLPRVPALRLMYCDFLFRRRRRVTETRRQFDASLRAIPITQHHLIWRQYLPFVFQLNLPHTIKPVLKRFIQLYPQYSELYVSYLQKIGDADEAAKVMSLLVRNESFCSLIHATKQEQWLDFCLYISRNADRVKSVDGDKVIRMAIKKFPENIASLWCCLATYYGILGNFDLCCFTYDEALSQIRSASDFKTIYESYSAFLEAGVKSLIDRHGSRSEIQYRIGKLECLIDAREETLSSVRIRRNPNDVYEWMNRIQLFCRQGSQTRSDTPETETDVSFVVNKTRISKESIKNPVKVIEAFSEAINTVDVTNCVGSTAVLWIEFAHFYELFDDFEEARRVLERGCQARHRNLDSLVTVWCERVELELRHNQHSRALALVRESLLRRTPPGARRKGSDAEGGTRQTTSVTETGDQEEADRDMTDSDLLDPLQYRLHRSPKLWALCVDMEESFGTFQSMRSAYDKMFEMKTITIPQIIGLGEILEKKGFYEDSFQVYEKGVNLFRWPHLNELWIYYLSKFVSRYGSRKLDRARELFERVLADVPKQFASRFYFIYAKYEEHFGLIRNALSIYHRAIQNIEDKHRLAFYKILVHTTAEYFGLTKTRQIFDEALKNVADDDVKEIGMRYAQMEAALMETDRARSIYEHVATFCDPQVDTDFWQEWRKFELNRGDEETFREMLRKRRSVASQFEEINALKFDETQVAELESADEEN